MSKQRKVENGQVAVPRDYFLRMAKLDYNSYKDALAREFYQNSVDAGSTSIVVTFHPTERKIVVKDNGIGMDYSTIKDKLLVLGGSKKRTGDVGAFGKAKEVLYFSWERYEVRSRNLLVKGMGANYSIETVDDWHSGTVSTIWIWEDEEWSNFRWAFSRVARKFQVSTTIKVDDDIISCDLRRGQFIRDLGWAELFVDNRVREKWNCEVRIQGQWMFQQWHGEDDVGQLVLELKKSSVDCLTSNRDALKSEYKNKLSALIREITLDKKSALEAANPTIRKKYSGSGKVEVNMHMFAQELKKHLASILGEDEVESGLIEVTDENREQVFDAILDLVPAENMNPARMDRIEFELAKKGFSFDLERLSFIGYEPDFVTVYETKDRAWCERFMSETKKARVLARAWTEVLKQVLLDIEWYGTFTAGFNFELKKAAAYEKVGGEHYFYLNPRLLLDEVDEEYKKIRYDSPKVRHMIREDLLQKAIHEISHLEVNYHNESFTTQAEWVRARTWKSMDVYPAIVDEAFVD